MCMRVGVRACDCPAFAEQNLDRVSRWGGSPGRPSARAVGGGGGRRGPLSFWPHHWGPPHVPSPGIHHLQGSLHLHSKFSHILKARMAHTVSRTRGCLGT